MRHLSLFTGSGIGDYAAAQCGIETVAQCEIDPCCMYCLEQLFPGILKFKDVRDVSVESLRSVLPIDIISAGVPCQTTSVAGKGMAHQDTRWLWPKTLDILDQVRPSWGIFENPLGLRTRGLDGILAVLESMGYSTCTLVIPAYAAGLRHHRKRIWIMAHSSRNGLVRVQNIFEQAEGWWNLAIEPLAIPAWARGLGTLAEVPCYTDGMAGGLLPKARNALLRMVGNGWCYPIPLFIYQWIAAQDELAKQSK